MNEGPLLYKCVRVLAIHGNKPCPMQQAVHCWVNIFDGSIKNLTLIQVGLDILILLGVREVNKMHPI